MDFERNELNKNSHGGTERMMEQLFRDLPEDLLKNYQIIPSRVREIDATKHRILYLHDLAEDPEAKLAVELNGGWARFHKIVFVSQWQRNQFVNKYEIPWSRTTVIPNSITPIEPHVKPKDKINLIYHTTPHRGLNILVAAYKKLQEKHKDIHLNVYSSFGLYGWNERDEQPYIKAILDDCKNTPGISYHGFKPNEEIRTALKNSHIFAYPSIWQETSCIALIEAMSAGCVCVHPDYAALPETAANWTLMYGWQEDINAHAQHFINATDIAITAVRENLKNENYFNNQLSSQMGYVNLFNNWEIKKRHWIALLESIKNEPLEVRNNYKSLVYEA